MVQRKQRAKVWDRGFSYHRTEGTHEQAIREKAFADEWRKEAPQIVSQILIPSYKRRSPFELYIWGEPAVRLTRLHRAIIATFIQWLGSNVGFSFLTSTLEKCGYKVVRKENYDKMAMELFTLKRAQKQTGGGTG